MKQKKTVIAVTALVVLALAAGAVYWFFGPKTTQGKKTITVQVVFLEGEPKEHAIQTDAEYLRGALEQEKLIAGEDGEFGMFVQTVDGVTVDEAKQQWWCFTKGGEQVNTGIDSTPIADGDHFEITLTEGY